MTVRELMEFLQECDPDTVIVYDNYYETVSPHPILQKTNNHELTYWDALEIKSLPKNTTYLRL